MIIATMQRRAIIVRRLAVLIRLVRSATQRGFALVLIFDHLPTILECSQSRLHLIELRGGHDVLIFWRQDLRDLLLRVFYAIRSRWVRGKGLRERAWFLLLGGFDLLEEVDHRLRIV